MAVSCDPNDLMAAAKCFDKCVSAGEHQAVQTYLLAVIAGVEIDPDALMNAAKCIRCYIPRGMLEEVQVYLLCQILNK